MVHQSANSTPQEVSATIKPLFKQPLQIKIEVLFKSEEIEWTPQ